MRVLQADASTNTLQQTIEHPPVAGDVIYFGVFHSRNPVPRDIATGPTTVNSGGSWTALNGTTGSRIYWFRNSTATGTGSVAVTLTGSATTIAGIIHLRPDDPAEDLTNVAFNDLEETIGAGLTSQVGPNHPAHRGQAVFAIALGGNPVALADSDDGLYFPVSTSSSAFGDATWAKPIDPLGVDVNHEITMTCASSSYTGIAQIVIGDADPGPTPQRFRLSDAGGVLPGVTPAFDALWDVTVGSGRRVLSEPNLSTVGLGTNANAETVNGPADVLFRQHITWPIFPAMTVAGDWRMVIQGLEGNAANNMFLNAVAKLTQDDGTVIATVYPGQGTHTPSANPADPNYELGTSLASRVLGSDVAGTVVPRGARFQLEWGYSDDNDATSRSGSFRWGDAPAASELPFAVDNTDTTLRPWVEFTTFDPPTDPIDVECDATTSTITLTWSPPTGFGVPDYYEVQINGGGWVNVGNVLTYEFTGLLAETAYTVEVRAVNDAGTSDSASCSTDTAPVDPPEGVSCTATNNTVTLTWSPLVTLPPVTGYEVQINGGDPIPVGNVTEWTFEELDPGTEYIVGVRAVSEAGHSVFVTCTTETTTAGCPDCDVRWLIESCGITTGRVRAVLQPTMFDVQTSLNVSGQGTLTFPTRGVKTRDIWPHLALIAISRIVEDPTTPEGVWLGYSERLTATASENGGTTQVGVVEITEYLRRRRLRTTMTFENVDQTQIAAEVVNAVVGVGVIGSLPITAEYEPSDFPRTRTYNGYERLTVAEIIDGLANIIDGLDWEVTYQRIAGEWSATITFRDEVGANRGTVLQSDEEASAYGLDVDAAVHATWVDAIGEGEEDAMLIATARDLDGIYPQFDEITTYKEVGVTAELQEYADGDLERMKEPAAIPSLTVAGNDPPPSLLRLGDTVRVDLDYGAIAYHGDARLVDITWTMNPDSPDMRQLNFEPIDRPSTSVLNAVSTDPCEGCD